MSPRFSYCKPTTHREKFNRRHSLNLPEQLPVHYSKKVTERTQKATSKSVADLVGEIAALEQEVIRKELHLLSLYRRAFDQYVSESCSFTSEQVDQETLKNIDEGALRLRDIKHSAAFNLPTVSKSEIPKSGARHSSLVNFLSASISEYVPKISCKLSEDILSCIAAVYCKLSSTQLQDAECTASPSPSVSSSSTFSPRRRNDSWSPRFNFDSPRQHGFQKEENEQNIGMIVIPRIRIDADKFDYASKMLETIRSLIQRLEKVDPLKMTHEEQLCFWINIHNALVMHAFLAYGLHDKRMKSTDMILKAAYNVGGQSVNAQTIQNSILGCQSHRPSLWVRALFTPAKRSTAGTARHPYALHHPEPIAHFTLSTGPAVHGEEDPRSAGGGADGVHPGRRGGEEAGAAAAQGLALLRQGRRAGAAAPGGAGVGDHVGRPAGGGPAAAARPEEEARQVRRVGAVQVLLQIRCT
ncbi:unnamed protein product [Urochloa decumbens]|uniref:DUF547 domain-containing protein n=1 Tax=Urochloa decumbens TaxID=240449 RepID=A0ABC9G430_9POAL